MKYTHEQIVSRIGEQGYRDLSLLFLTLGFEDIATVPDMLWETAIQMYEEEMYKRAA